MGRAEHLRAAKHSGLRYPNDLTNDEPASIDSMIAPAKHSERRRLIKLREEGNRGPVYG